MTGARLPILVYHQISTSATTATDDGTAISLDRFRSHMRFLNEEGYRTLSTNETARFLRGEAFPEKIVAIQFEDGWRAGLAALPILNDLDFKASFASEAGAKSSGGFWLTASTEAAVQRRRIDTVYRRRPQYRRACS